VGKYGNVMGTGEDVKEKQGTGNKEKTEVVRKKNLKWWE
jgi:hypothetical protein